MAWAFVSIKSSFFFNTLFTRFSILLGNSDGVGGIRISSLILIFGRHLSNRPLKIRGYQKSHFWFFWRAFLLQILLIFEDITELYMLRPLLGRTIDQKTEYAEEEKEEEKEEEEGGSGEGKRQKGKGGKSESNLFIHPPTSRSPAPAASTGNLSLDYIIQVSQ